MSEVTCRGSYVLGTACGRCTRCKLELKSLESIVANNKATGNVLQPWISNLKFMQQTVLLTAIRGPDGIGKYHPSKFMLRWYRRCVLYQALDHKIVTTPYDPSGGSFTGPSYNTAVGEHDWYQPMQAVFENYLKSLDELPHHFQLHFLHAAEILGYKHPDDKIRMWWLMVYLELCRDMHLHPEQEFELDRRLGDNEQHWRESNHVATQE